MVGACGMAPEYVELRCDDESEDEARERVMKRFQKIGSQIVNRSSSGPAGSRQCCATRRQRVMVEQLLGQAYLAAHHLVAANKDAVERVAEALVQRRELYGDEVVRLLDAQYAAGARGRPDSRRGLAAPVIEKHHFRLAYGVLALAFWISVAGFIVLLTNQHNAANVRWSSWKPTEQGLLGAHQIALRVGSTYRSPQGTQLVAVQEHAPYVQGLHLEAVGVRRLGPERPDRPVHRPVRHGPDADLRLLRPRVGLLARRARPPRSSSGSCGARRSSSRSMPSST